MDEQYFYANIGKMGDDLVIHIPRRIVTLGLVKRGDAVKIQKAVKEDSDGDKQTDNN